MRKERAIRLGRQFQMYRKLAGLTQQELADRTGKDRQYISGIERGEQEGPDPEFAERAAPLLGVTKAQLLLLDNELPGVIIGGTPTHRRWDDLIEIPVRGTKPAGYPLPEIGDRLDKISVPRGATAGMLHIESIYAVRVMGESLAGDRIHDGDYVLVDPYYEFTDSKIYLVRIGSEEVLRHVKREGDIFKLFSSNNHYEDLLPGEGEILGKVLKWGGWHDA